MHHPRRGPVNHRGQRPYQQNLGRGMFETMGPGGKFRGTAQQLVDRYIALGKDALSRREYIRAEECFQHAEHYRRLAAQNAAEKSNEKQEEPRRHSRRNEQEEFFEKDDDGSEEEQEEQDFNRDNSDESLPSFLLMDEGNSSVSEDSDSSAPSGEKNQKRRPKSAVRGPALKEAEPMRRGRSRRTVSDEAAAERKVLAQQEESEVKTVAVTKRRRRVKKEDSEDV